VKTTAVVMRGGARRGADWLTIAAAFDAIFVTASFLAFEYIVESEGGHHEPTPAVLARWSSSAWSREGSGAFFFARRGPDGDVQRIFTSTPRRRRLVPAFAATGVASFLYSGRSSVRRLRAGLGRGGLVFCTIVLVTGPSGRGRLVHLVDLGGRLTTTLVLG